MFRARNADQHARRPTNGRRTLRTARVGATRAHYDRIHSEVDHRRLSAHRPAYITKVGEREVFRLKLADGREIRATGDHKLLTADNGWKRLDELKLGLDPLRFASPADSVTFASDAADAKRWQMLGWLTGDGVFNKDTVALVFGPRERRTAEFMTEQLNELKAVAVNFSEPPINVRTSQISAQSNGVMQTSRRKRRSFPISKRATASNRRPLLRRTCPARFTGRRKISKSLISKDSSRPMAAFAQTAPRQKKR